MSLLLDFLKGIPVNKQGLTYSPFRNIVTGGFGYNQPDTSRVIPETIKAPVEQNNIPENKVVPKKDPIFNRNNTSPTIQNSTASADPKAMLESAKKVLGGGDVPAYSAVQFQNTNPTVVQAETTATELNNARNDLATGAADPYKWASKSGIPFTASELSAIESAAAGVYDPAIDSALARLDDAQQKSKMAEQFKYDLALKQAPDYKELSAEKTTTGTDGTETKGATLASNLANSNGLKYAVGTGLGRGLFRTNPDRVDFTNKIEQLLSYLTLNTFKEAKAAGTTFGAMSEGEWEILRAAASEIGNARVKSGGRTVGFNMSEDAMKSWLNSLAKGGPGYEKNTDNTKDKNFTEMSNEELQNYIKNNS